jgi:hypothetical protein
LPVSTTTTSIRCIDYVCVYLDYVIIDYGRADDGAPNKS